MGKISPLIAQAEFLIIRHCPALRSQSDSFTRSQSDEKKKEKTVKSLRGKIM